MKVELITPEVYTDDFVVDCARVSFDKSADQYTPEQNARLIKYLANPPEGVPHWAPFAGPRICFNLTAQYEDWLDFFSGENTHGFSWALVKEDGSRRTYEISGSLWAWLKHSSIFTYLIFNDIESQFPVSFKSITWVDPKIDVSKVIGYKPTHASTIYENLRITAPFCIARQFDKHQRHIVKNEVSRRYVSSKVTLNFPKKLFKRPSNIKQGSSDEKTSILLDFLMKGTCKLSVLVYNVLVKFGVAPEQARYVLPNAAETTWIWTGSLEAFARCCRERLGASAQREARELGQMIHDQIAKKHGDNWMEWAITGGRKPE